MATVENAIPANYDNLSRRFHCFQRGETELYLFACNALFEAINSGRAMQKITPLAKI